MTEFLSQPAVARLGWALVHFLWQGAAVAALLAAALLALRKRTPNARYLVACAALLLMAVAPVGTFVWLARPVVTSVKPQITQIPQLPQTRRKQQQ